MTTYKIDNTAAARLAARAFGVSLPPGSGRFPTSQLADAARLAGDQIDTSEYVTGGKTTTYLVSAFVKFPNTDVATFCTGIVRSDQARKESAQSRGRLSMVELATSAAKVNHWPSDEITFFEVIPVQ